MSENTNNKSTLEICKKLREETGISIGLCNEAAKESNGEIVEARKLLREKCIKVGEKYYCNEEKSLLYSALYMEESSNFINLVKIGCQSDYLIAGLTLEELSKKILKEKLENKNKDEGHLKIIDELKFYSGMVKENIQLIHFDQVKKADDENFYIIKSNHPSNMSLYGSITIIKHKGDFPQLEEESDLIIKQALNINIHAFLKKNIINIPDSPEKKINAFLSLENNELNDFLVKPMVTDKTKSIKSLFEEHNFNLHIVSIFVI